MEKIYIYSQIKEKNDQLKNMCGIILRVLLPLIKLHLKNNFDKILQENNEIKNSNFILNQENQNLKQKM